MDNEAVMLCEQQCYHTGCSRVKEDLMKKLDMLKKIRNNESSSITRVIVEHMKPYEIATNIVFRAMMYTDNFREPRFQFFIKTSKIITVATNRCFKNEILFYHIFEKSCIDFIPKSYITEYYELTPSIIILDSLFACGFRQQENKLCTKLLKKFVKGLAHFHANILKTKKEDYTNYNCFMAFYLAPDKDQEKVEQQQAASDFLNSPVMKNEMYSRDELLKTKIIKKLEKVKHLEESSISILNHGSYTRFHIFYKEENDSEFSLKLVDFQTLKLGSPVIDFGRILFTNLPNGYSSQRLVNFCRELLSLYTTTLREIFPEVIREHWEQDIINNLLFSYINLNANEKEAIKDHKTILLALDSLGSFD